MFQGVRNVQSAFGNRSISDPRPFGAGADGTCGAGTRGTDEYSGCQHPRGDVTRRARATREVLPRPSVRSHLVRSSLGVSRRQRDANPGGHVRKYEGDCGWTTDGWTLRCDDAGIRIIRLQWSLHLNSVAWDTSIKTDYRYDIQTQFDWQGSTQPWNGTLGDDGIAIYWGNSLNLRSDYFWGKYRDGSNLQDVSRSDAPPQSGVAWSFWEAKNNCCSIADFGWLTATVSRNNYTNFQTTFAVKYIHSWQNLSYAFSWGNGPSVNFSPANGSQGIAASTWVNT